MSFIKSATKKLASWRNQHYTEKEKAELAEEEAKKRAVLEARRRKKAIREARLAKNAKKDAQKEAREGARAEAAVRWQEDEATRATLEISSVCNF